MTDPTRGYSDYSEIALPPSPTPERIGSWWRRRWTFAVSGKVDGTLSIPPPLSEEIDTAIVVTSWWASDVDLIVEIFTKDEAMGGSEITYVSLIGAWFQLRVPEVQISLEGMVNHSLLQASRISPTTAQLLRDFGY